MKVMLVSNTTWNIFNFRMNLAAELRDRGCEVVAVGVADGYEDNIRELGYGWAEWKITRRSINPFSELGAVNNLRRVYRSEKPDVVQHFTIKPVLYGTIAAKLAGVPAVVNSITGLPYFLTSRPDHGLGGLAKKFSLSWYARCCLGRRRRSLFQNHDDVELLSQYDRRIAENAVMIPGSGVDLNRFAYVPPPPLDDKPSANRPLRVVCVARLIREKGVFDLVQAAKQIGKQRDDVEFVFCGSPDQGNRTSVDAETFQSWQQEKNLSLLGHVDNVHQVLRDADIVALPSYREGTPRSLLEAAAIGRPIVTTDVPGCRETVTDGVSGILVPPRDPDALAAALLRLIDDAKLRESMGQAGRAKAETQFDEQIVIQRTLAVYEDLLGHAMACHPEGAAP